LKLPATSFGKLRQRGEFIGFTIPPPTPKPQETGFWFKSGRWGRFPSQQFFTRTYFENIIKMMENLAGASCL